MTAFPDSSPFLQIAAELRTYQARLEHKAAIVSEHLPQAPSGFSASAANDWAQAQRDFLDGFVADKVARHIAASARKATQLPVANDSGFDTEQVGALEQVGAAFRRSSEVGVPLVMFIHGAALVFPTKQQAAAIDTVAKTVRAAKKLGIEVRITADYPLALNQRHPLAGASRIHC